MNSDEALSVKQVGIVYFGGLLLASLLLVLLNATSVITLSPLWQFAPLWMGWLVLFAIGQVIVLRKFFRNKYWR